MTAQFMDLIAGNPLIMAAHEGHLNIVSVLLDVVKLLVAWGANVNARVHVEEPAAGFSEWRTPLSMSERGRHRAVVEFLKSVGAR